MLETLKSELRLFLFSQEKSDQNNRMIWIDMAKGIAIILVVMGHRGFISSQTNTWLSSFHLPLFFIASGILFERKNEQNSSFRHFFTRKWKGIMIPYLLFSVASILLNLWRNRADLSTAFTAFREQMLLTITLQGYSVLWFLPVIFLAELIFRAIYKRRNLYITTAVITLLSLGFYEGYQSLLTASFTQKHELFLGMGRILVKTLIGAAFMSYGAMFIKIMENRCEKKSLWEFLLGIVLGAVNVLTVSFYQLKDLNNCNLGNLVSYLFLGVMGSISVMLICKNIINIPPLTYLGRNSLIILCTHLNFYVLYYGTICFLKTPVLGQSQELWVQNILTMFYTCVLSVFVIMGIQVFAPFMIGKWYKKSTQITTKKTT